MSAIELQFLILNVAQPLQTDYLLLMKQQIDDLVAQDEQIQALLTWVSQKSYSVPTTYEPLTVRAFYFDLAVARALVVDETLALAIACNRTLTCNLERHLALDLSLDRALGLEQVIPLTRDPSRVFERVLERAIAHACTITPDLEQALQLLKQQLPDDSKEPYSFRQWWSLNGQVWIEQLRLVTSEHRQIGYDWQFSTQQRSTLKQYYDFNYLLVDCLSDFCLTSTVRQEIEKVLLLPMTEISLHDTW